MEKASTPHIERSPGTCGGKARVAGTRITVQDIHVWAELEGRMPAEIVHDFPQLSIAGIHAALTYFHDHREEVQAEMRRDEELVAKFKSTAGPNLLERLRGGDRGPPVSS
jgi:uncharacterized protein (DUF433 family)